MILSHSNTLRIQEKFSKAHGISTRANKPLAEIEKSYIIEVLNECDWRIGGKTGAAKILDLPDSTLRSRMKKLKIHRN